MLSTNPLIPYVPSQAGGGELGTVSTFQAAGTTGYGSDI